MRGTYILENTEAETSQDTERVTEQEILTFWRPEAETSKDMKESNQLRSTHILETTEAGTSQNMERKQLREAYSLPRDHSSIDKSGHRKKVIM